MSAESKTSKEPERNRLLQQNPDPIKLVPREQRDVWFRRAEGWRCEHEDGRGRCSATDTKLYRVASQRIPEAYCAKHAPIGERP